MNTKNALAASILTLFIAGACPYSASANTPNKDQPTLPQVPPTKNISLNQQYSFSYTPIVLQAATVGDTPYSSVNKPAQDPLLTSLKHSLYNNSTWQKDNHNLTLNTNNTHNYNKTFNIDLNYDFNSNISLKAEDFQIDKIQLKDPEMEPLPRKTSDSLTTKDYQNIMLGKSDELDDLDNPDRFGIPDGKDADTGENSVELKISNTPEAPSNKSQHIRGESLKSRQKVVEIPSTGSVPKVEDRNIVSDPIDVPEDGLNFGRRKKTVVEHIATMRPQVVDAHNSVAVAVKYTIDKGKPDKINIPIFFHIDTGEGSELQISWDTLNWRGNKVGLGDATIGYKVNCFRSEHDDIGVLVFCEFPTGSSAYSDPGLEPGINISYGHSFSDTVYFIVSGGAQRLMAANHDGWIKVNYATQISKDITDKHTIWASISGSGLSENTEDGIHKLEGHIGLDYSPNESSSYSISLNRGFAPTGLRWSVITAFTQRF